MIDITSGRAIDVMRGELETIPTMIETQVKALRPQLRALVLELRDEQPEPPEVVLTGCGDSYFAGLGARLTFERNAKVRCRAVEALELTRYDVRYVPTVPRPPLLVALSYSGEVGRTIEAVATATRFGWRTIALTGRPRARLARSVDRPILIDVPTLGLSPGTSTYVAMLTALTMLAAEIARAWGRIEGAEAIDKGLVAAPTLAGATLLAAEEPAAALAANLVNVPVTTILGAGPSHATAKFAAAKFYETAQRWALAEDLEEWAHGLYFVSSATTPVIIVAPGGASRDRAAELMSEMTYNRTPAILVTNVVDDSVAMAADAVLPFAAGLDEALSPILSCLPLAQLAFHLARSLGTHSYGLDGGERERMHYDTIHRDTRAEPA